MYARRASGSMIIRRGTWVVKTVATTLPIALLLAVRDADQPGLGPELQAEAAALPAQAAHLRAAERHPQVAEKKTVHPHHPGFDSIGDSQRAIDVGGPHVRRQPEAGRVGARDRLFLVVESLDSQHRSEDF